MPTSTKIKPVAGHRCQPPRIGVSVSCECGWTSAMWYGSGARKEAYKEWRWHIDQCQPCKEPK